jgi:hypothetical protein
VPNGAARWTPVDFRTAARQLGTFNGAWLASRALPRHDFLSRDWLRAFVGEFAPAYVRLTRSATLRRHPLVRRCWPDGLFDRTLALWADRDGLLATLDAVPHTFCHLDAFSRNLVVGPAGVIALDWAFAGIAPLGAELAPLVAASVIYGDAEPEALRDLDALAFDAYLDGLREAGWRGDVRVVRLGFAATVALRYGLFPLGVHLANAELRERLERSLRRDACDVARRWARISAYLLDRLDETRPPR